MGAGAACSVRLSVIETATDLSEDVNKVDQTNRGSAKYVTAGLPKLRRLRLVYEGAGSATKTEISAPNTVFDGTTTPAKLYIDSTSASDNDIAAGHARVGRLIGIDENNELVIGERAFAGTTGGSGLALQYLSTYKGAGTAGADILWKRIIHAYVSSWGTGGGDAAGTITIQNDAAGTTDYLTIAAGANESDGAALWIPANFAFIIHHADLLQKTMTNVARGSQIIIDWINFTNGADPDFDSADLIANAYRPHDTKEGKEVYLSNGSGKITFSENYLIGAETLKTTIDIYIMGTSNTARGRPA